MGKKTSSQTQENKIPAWVENFGRDTMNRAGTLSEDGKSYIPEFSPETMAYFDSIKNFKGGSNVSADAVSSGTVNFNPISASLMGDLDPAKAAQVGAVDNIKADSLAGNIGAFMSPYTNSVVDASLGDLRNEYGKATAAAGLDQAAGGAFGGGRHGIREAQAQDDYLRTAASTSANLRDQGFRTALQGATAQGGQNLSAAQSNQGTALQRAISQAGFENQTGLQNAILSADRSRFNAGQGQAANIFNSEGAFRAGTYNNDAALRAGMFNSDANLRAGMFNSDNAFRNETTNIGLQGSMGSQIDDRNRQVAEEPWTILQRRAALLGMTPYPTTTSGTTTDSKMRAWAPYAAAAGSAACWVAREVYGIENPKWLDFREWMLNDSPAWFRALYLKFGERFAKFISDKPKVKAVIRRWMDSKV